MKKLLYLLALPVGLGLLWGFTVDVVNVVPKNGDMVITQDQPFIQRTNLQIDKGYQSEQITLNTINGKHTTIKITYGGAEYQKAEVWLYINNKLYSEENAQKFDKNFIAKLSEKRGYGTSKNYNIPAIDVSKLAYVFWFGNEPKLSSNTAKSRSYFQKYNGKTVDGQIVEVTYSPATKVMNGFLIKTANGEMLKANVETKFAEQTKAMLSKGDKINVKIYNANYWKDSEYPVLTSYKISKGGKLLYDRWPKTASNKIGVNNETPIAGQNQPFNKLTKPTLISSTYLRVDNKNNISYIKNGIMEINGARLEGKDMTWDMNKGEINAIGAVLISKDGTKTSSETIDFYLEKGAYKIKNRLEASLNNSSVFNLFSNLNYQAMDSTRVSKTENTVTLYGKAKVNIDGKILEADKIEVNKNSAIVTAYNAELTGVEKDPIKAKVISYNVATKQVRLKDVLRNGSYWDRVIN